MKYKKISKFMGSVYPAVNTILMHIHNSLVDMKSKKTTMKDKKRSKQFILKLEKVVIKLLEEKIK